MSILHCPGSDRVPWQAQGFRTPDSIAASEHFCQEDFVAFPAGDFWLGAVKDAQEFSRQLVQHYPQWAHSAFRAYGAFEEWAVCQWNAVELDYALVALLDVGLHPSLLSERSRFMPGFGENKLKQVGFWGQNASPLELLEEVRHCAYTENPQEVVRFLQSVCTPEMAQQLDLRACLALPGYRQRTSPKGAG